MKNIFLHLSITGFIFISAVFCASESPKKSEKKQTGPYSEDQIILTEPGEIAALLVSNFNDYNTYTSSFKEYNNGKVRRGSIRFVKPDLFRVDYFDTYRNTTMEIYSDSEKLYVYLKSINIVCEQDLVPDSGEEITEESEEAEELPAVLVNLDRLIKSYNFNFVESKKMVEVLKDSELKRFKMPFKKSVKAYHFYLTPRDKTLGLNHMELWISNEGIVKRCKTITLDKKVIDFLFYETEMNKSIPRSVFEFEIPANAQVVKNLMMDFEKTRPNEDPKE